MRYGAKIKIISAEAVWPLASRVLNLSLAQARLDHSDHARRDPVLQIEHIVKRAIEFIGPEMRAGRGLDELAGNPYAATRLAHASFQHITHAKLAPDLLHVHGFALVNEARIARDH